MAAFVPVHGHQSATRTQVAEEPDTAVVDSDMYVEDDDWAGTADADSMVADSADVDSDNTENFATTTTSCWPTSAAKMPITTCKTHKMPMLAFHSTPHCLCRAMTIRLK